MLSKQPTLIRPLVGITRKRVLSHAGEVMVSAGQEVNGSEIIAQANLHDHHVLVDVKDALQIKKMEDVAKVLNCKLGERLEEGDIIAETGRIKRIVRAPMSGVVTAISAGKVILEVQGRREQVRAGYSGVVMQVLHRQGAVIRCNGALVQGVWGNRQSGSGILMQIGNDASSELETKFLSVDMRGALLFAGSLRQTEVLRQLANLNIRGLILGTMAASMIPLAREVKFPIMLTDGFGYIGMNLAAYEILNTNVNREVNLIAYPADDITGDKPEAFIPLPADGEEPSEVLSIKPGRMVRIMSYPNQGQIGEILRINPGKVKLQNGILARAATIQLTDKKQITVPLENLDLLE
jgi:transcription antitermination factor NusG